MTQRRYLRLAEMLDFNVKVKTNTLNSTCGLMGHLCLMTLAHSSWEPPFMASSSGATCPSKIS